MDTEASVAASTDTCAGTEHVPVAQDRILNGNPVAAEVTQTFDPGLSGVWDWTAMRLTAPYQYIKRITGTQGMY